MKKLILILTLFIMNPYYSQSLKDFDLNTRTFDIETYNKNKNDSGNYGFDLDNHIEVYQHYWDKDIVEEKIYADGDPYSIRRLYYYPSGKLNYIGKKFYNFDIGTSKSFDENGKLDKVYNEDYLYTFSVEDLIKKMKEEYGIDLSVVTDEYRVSRHHTSPTNNTKPLYTVYVYNLIKDSIQRDGGFITNKTYNIDGSTGNIIKITERVRMGEDGVWTEITEQYGPVDHIVYRHRYYEMNSKGELIKITEQKYYRIGDFAPEILEEKIIYEKPGNKEGAYHIHKGKKYTEPQWDKLKEDELKKYARKNNISLGKDKGTGFFLDEREI